MHSISLWQNPDLLAGFVRVSLESTLDENMGEIWVNSTLRSNYSLIIIDSLIRNTKVSNAALFSRNFQSNRQGKASK